jgi:hypothetical protein
MYVGFHVKECAILVQSVIKNRICRQGLVKIPPTKFHGNPPSESRAVPDQQREERTDGETKKCSSQLLANAPNNSGPKETCYDL